VAVLLSLAAALSWGTSDFFGGLAGRRSPHDISVATALWSQVGGLVGAALIVAVTTGEPLTTTDLWASIGAGAAGSLAVAALYRGLRVGRMGVVAPITGALAASLPVAVGAGLGERPEPLAWAGLAATLAAIVLASRPAAEHATADGEPTGVLPAIAAGIGFATVFVLLDATGDATGMLPFVPMKATAIVLLLAAGTAARQPLVVGRAVVPLVIGVVLLDNAANLTFLLATRSGLLTVAAVLSSLYPVVTVLLARFREHEHLARHQQVGLVLAIGGVLAVAAA
jgi:drug/metabolite transporter (DMT)-like permease